MKEQLAAYLVYFLRDVSSLDSSLVILVFLIVIGVIVLDSLLSRIQESAKETGIEQLGNRSSPLEIEGTKTLPVKDYVSEKQGLSGRPDAILEEDGFLIPVEHKPMAKKLRDRHIAQLLVYMRLIEELEGKRPPYGYLILGRLSRKVKILNTRERQAWLQRILDEMMAVHDGKQAVPAPHPHKCSNCRVQALCEFNVTTTCVTVHAAVS